MKQFNYWKSFIVINAVLVFIALQPIVTYACGVGTHTGCG